jgi:hypothetical protein
MFATQLRTLLAEWLLRWQGGGERPQDHDDVGPRWYDLPHWC